MEDQEDCSKRTNNETEFFSLTDSEFRKEIMRILKALRRAINRNADSCKKELETINYEKPRKIRKLIC